MISGKTSRSNLGGEKQAPLEQPQNFSVFATGEDRAIKRRPDPNLRKTLNTAGMVSQFWRFSENPTRHAEGAFFPKSSVIWEAVKHRESREQTRQFDVFVF